jgi:hypothetical protein
MRDKDRELLEEAYLSIYLREAVQQSYIQKIIELNKDMKMPDGTLGWTPEKAIAAFPDEYDPEDVEDIGDHVDYEENKEEFVKNLERFVPGVRVGDWVSLNIMGGGIGKNTRTIGQIQKETRSGGRQFGYEGSIEPNVYPAWEIKVYRSNSPNMNAQFVPAGGTVDLPMHKEIQSNSGREEYNTYTKEGMGFFSKLASQSQTPNIAS